MNPLRNSFEDPEFQAAMKRAGVVHKPGMAADLMKELAPLLAADGIDFDDERADFDLDQLNSAMGRAVERHNLALFTPVGQDRAQALEVLAEFASALAAGGQSAAEPILKSIKPEKTSSRPAASHAMGAGLGLIDTWFASSEYAALLARARVQRWRGQAKRIATDLKVLGASGRAFEAHSSIILKYGGELLMHGVMLLVGSAVVAVAEQEGVSAEAAFERLNSAGAGGAARRQSAPADFPSTQKGFSGSAFGLGADGQLPRPDATAGPEAQGDELFFEGFEDSLEGLSNIQIDATLSILHGISSIADSVGLSVHSPEDCVSLIEMIADFTDTGAKEDALNVLHDYVHYRMAEDMFPEDWDDTHALLESVQFAEDSGFALLYGAIEDAHALPPEELQRALTSVRPVAAVRELLDWMGASKPVTGTGGLRRADIGTVAAMIGVRAEGVARLPWGKYWVKPEGAVSQEPEGAVSQEPEGAVSQRPEGAVSQEPDGRAAQVPDESASEEAEVILAQTMWAVPKLAHWWAALQASDVIEVTKSRVRPGPGIARETGGWAEASLPAILCSALVAESLTDGLHPDDDFGTDYSRMIVEETIRRAVEVLDEDGYRAEDYAPEELTPEEAEIPEVRWGHVREQILEGGVTRRFFTLLEFELLEEQDGALVAPKELRGVVAQGILMAFEYLMSAESSWAEGLDED